jgi:DHA1 family bicyclomycin/chloramphenicol resistance-like MFS transporter
MLGSMSALGAFSIDVYLPNLPEVAADLHTSDVMAQYTMTFMMIGAAIGQLVVGPLSDKFGRRKPALIGVALHVVTAIGCALAPSIYSLISLRAAMGIFNASAGVVASAVLRDRFVGREAARIMSRLMLVVGVAPLFAPTIGSFIADFVGWRGVFGALALYGAALWLVMFLKLPETLEETRRIAKAPWVGFIDVLKDRKFLGLAIIPALMGAVLMSYVVGSPFVLREYYGLSTREFAAVFALNGSGLVIGAQINAALVRRFTSAQVLRVALPVSATLISWLFVVGFTGLGGLKLLIISLFAVTLANNIAPPNASALALARFGDKAGTAAATLGFLQSAIPALISPIVGLLGADATAMTSVMFATVLAALAVLALATPVYRKGGAAELDAVGLT